LQLTARVPVLTLYKNRLNNGPAKLAGLFSLMERWTGERQQEGVPPAVKANEVRTGSRSSSRRAIGSRALELRFSVAPKWRRLGKFVLIERDTR
jgi:hypothetical protein